MKIENALADMWYALSAAAIRYPDHFQTLSDTCFQELAERRGAGLNPWLDERFRAFRQDGSKKDAKRS
jgi:hypothetical protein